VNLTKSPIFTYDLQISGFVPAPIPTLIPVGPFYKFDFIGAGDFPDDYSKPVVVVGVMGPRPIFYQVTDFHLISSTFQPFGILDSPGPYIQAANDFAQAAVQKVPMRSSSVSVLFIL